MSTAKPSVLFLCTGNSCRSQMAEAWLRHLSGGKVRSLSAGTKPVGINPLAIASMSQVGIDISAQSSDNISAYLSDPPDVIIAVCDRAGENCPSFPGATQVLSWPFPDPAHAEGSEAAVAAIFAQVRDDIRARITAWLDAGAAPLDLAASNRAERV